MIKPEADGPEQRDGVGVRVRRPLHLAGLNSPSLAAEDALKIAVDVVTGAKKPSDYPKESFTKARRDRL